MVVAEKCVRHAQRFKNILGGELTKGHAADTLDDVAPSGEVQKIPLISKATGVMD